MSDIIIPSLTQLLVQSPVLLVYLAGMVLAFVNWHRSPSTGMLVLFGTGLLMFSAVSWPFVFQYVIQTRADSGWDPARVGAIMSGMGFVSSLFRAVGVALVLGGAFVGRRGHTEDSSKPTAAHL